MVYELIWFGVVPHEGAVTAGPAALEAPTTYVRSPDGALVGCVQGSSCRVEPIGGIR